jgi:hypothetical protein
MLRNWGTHQDLAGKAKVEAPKPEVAQKKETPRGGGFVTARGSTPSYRGGRGRGTGVWASGPQRSAANATPLGTPRSTELPGVTCFGCGKQGHYKTSCPDAISTGKAKGPSVGALQEGPVVQERNRFVLQVELPCNEPGWKPAQALLVKKRGWEPIGPPSSMRFIDGRNLHCYGTHHLSVRVRHA